jgi:hypothetical protein
MTPEMRPLTVASPPFADGLLYDRALWGHTRSVDDRDAAKVGRRTVLFGWSAVAFGLLALVVVLVMCVVIYALYVQGIGS